MGELCCYDWAISVCRKCACCLYLHGFIVWFLNSCWLAGKDVKAYELRNKTKSELTTQLSELKSELQSLRIAQVTGGAPAKLAKIGTIRKSIARVLTVTNQITKSKVNIITCNMNNEMNYLSFKWCASYLIHLLSLNVCKITQLREKFAGAKFVPIDLRVKKTRAIRRRLTKEQVRFLKSEMAILLFILELI